MQGLKPRKVLLTHEIANSTHTCTRRLHCMRGLKLQNVLVADEIENSTHSWPRHLHRRQGLKLWNVLVTGEVEISIHSWPRHLHRMQGLKPWNVLSTDKIENSIRPMVLSKPCLIYLFCLPPTACGHDAAEPLDQPLHKGDNDGHLSRHDMRKTVLLMPRACLISSSMCLAPSPSLTPSQLLLSSSHRHHDAADGCDLRMSL